MKKRILSIILTLVLAVCLLPAAVQEAQAVTDGTITGIISTGDGYWVSFGTYYLDTENSGLVTASGASANFTTTMGPLCTDRSVDVSSWLKTEPELGETYYFWYRITQPTISIDISNAASTIEYTGFCNGRVLEAADLYSDGDIFVICSIMYGELTGGVRAEASGVEHDNESGGYIPRFTTLKCLSPAGDELEHVTIPTSNGGYYSYYGATAGRLYRSRSYSTFSDPLTTEPQVGETYYSYLLLNSIDGNLHIEEDLVDIQIPGYDVEFLAAYESDMGFTSQIVYSVTKQPVPGVYVNGVGLFDGDYLAVGASTTTTTAPSGGYAYYNEGTLTLSNYSYTGLGTAFQHPGTVATYDAVVYAPDALTVNLVGTNTLTVTGMNAGSVVNSCIWSAYDLTVQGTGSLTMEGADTGIAVFVGDLTVNNGRLVTRNVRNSLESWNKNIVINGGELDLSSPNSGIYADGAIRINGGHVTAVGSYRAINRGDEFVVSDSLKIRASTTEDGPLGEYVAADHDSYKKICITGPDIYVGGVGMITGEYLAAGATETTTAAPGGGYAYYSNGTLTLNGYSYEGPGHKYNTTWSYYAVIYANHDLTIDLVGANTLVQTAEESDSVHIDNGNLTIVGTGSLTNTDNHYGLFARKNVTVNSGTVVSNSGHSGLNSGNGNVVINGGNVTVSGRYGIITPYGSSYFTGGKITAVGSYQAIYSNIDVADGMTVQASTTADGALVEYVEADHDRYLKIVIEESLEAPTLKVSNVASTGKIKLTWNKVDGAAKYEIYRATSKNGTYSKLSTATGTSLTNGSATVGKTYYYKIRSVDANGNKSDWSNIVSRTADLAQPKVSVTNVTSSGKIKLSWEKIEGATKYEVYRATSKDGTYSKLTTVTGTSVTNTSAKAGTTYYYKVKAIHSNSSANSAYSSIVSRTCDLAQPKVTATNTASTGKIKLNWEKVEGATKYEVYRATSKNGTYTKLTTVTGTSVTNTSAKAGTTYYYKVKAIHSKSAANSADSAVVSRTCDLARPTVKVALNSNGKPVISWGKVDGAVKYTIYIYDANGNLLKTTSTTGLKLTHNSAVKGTTYKYRVVAVYSNTAANSAKSETVSIKSK